MIAIIDSEGNLTVEGVNPDLFSGLLPAAQDVACARPLAYAVLPNSTGADLRVHAIWHGDVTSGPGRRSVIQVQGCPIKCIGCYVPQTHDASSGVPLAVSDILPVLLADENRDGVTILGGEPFAQVEGVLLLVRMLRLLGVHVTIYSGYTLVTLLKRPVAREILNRVDVLVDGPYVAALADGAGEWRGSTNQRIIMMKERA